MEPARLLATIANTATGFGLSRTPPTEEIYDGRFLPPQDARMPVA
ncbi:hypothetical protein ACE7GA_10320 [Roseomonas sp. CCTCC AB2023176]